MVRICFSSVFKSILNFFLLQIIIVIILCVF